MITPSSIYWLTRLDNINILLLLLVAGAIALSCIMFTGYAEDKEFAENYADKKRKGRELAKAEKKRRIGLTSSIIGFILAIGMPFIPSTKEMAAIIVIPRIANSESVQQLGEGIITLAQDWLKELSPKKEETK